MDPPADRTTLGPTLRDAWRRSATGTRVLLVAWTVLPLVAVGVVRFWPAPDVPDGVSVLAPRTSQAFVRQQRLAQDASAKATVADLVPVMRRCGAVTTDFTRCTRPGRLVRFGGDPRSVAAFPAPGKVAVTASLEQTYTITAPSRTGAQFAITRMEDGALQRTCTPAGTDGCGPAGRW